MNTNIPLYSGESVDDERKYVQGFRTAEESNTGWNPDYGEIYTTASTFRKLKKKPTETTSDLYEAERRIMLNADPATQIQRSMEQYLGEIARVGVVYAENDRGRIMERFSRTPHKEYKHPLLFVLGFIMEHLDLATTMEVARRIGQDWVRETDIIRYYRLHQSLRSV
jgi:hypothetical protein